MEDGGVAELESSVEYLSEDEQHFEIGIHARDRAEFKRYSNSNFRFDTRLNLYDEPIDGFWQVYGEVVKEFDYEFPDAELYYADWDLPTHVLVMIIWVAFTAALILLE